AGLVYHACKTRYGSVDFVTQDLQANSTLFVASETIIRMMINLFENSYYSLEEKFKMLGESFRPQLRVKTHETKDDYFIEVYDNGMGIEQEVLDRVWLPFFTTKDVGDGTGLGLAMVHDIVSSYNGEVSVESLVGEFTCFKIRFPKVYQGVH
ncbi:MAG: sensor histidine kinase, partial [Bacteriovoracia bacterium]